MSEFFNMGGYAMYVWPSYGLTFVILLVHFIAPLLQRKRTLNDIARKIRRDRRKQQ
ncbi:hemagglutination activity protein [Candidatus Endoriftia persephone str. Guaymas]|jgi:heme exporter protein D|uniref:Heme exporter protein D n=4 Tax=Gammaproteobacteria TaxID=1236 RepID=G2FD54_9GAMM|nr:heme exporter protein CcmD [Candidatus Endoriftia persephone]MBA1330944.1 hemagglutination activity protein [Candidatus Endoriftia persephone str. Guaymas]EGV52169.1 cytochrome c-type biogenesis protein CcmD [endosymbiont of Riftia pachyptila (vent Ph05)]EGW55434.1 cytochrome c-type biogenesis protein CcmD [endosymbiont of Tevnia jerichonana (vent Tica)]KRT56403.1 heme exporter protein CcmD [endosymbiont of Ridgeia piscesae]KRT58575.1 heme exporter protein D [endosymbiont of Ridgeia piscesa